MFIFFNIFILISSLNLDIFLPLSQTLNQWCTARVQNSASSYIEIYLALLCGSKLPFNEELSLLFSSAGLIHLMVVSGAHLIFLEKIWERLPRWPYKNIFILLSLIIYALMTGINPPVFRALMSFFLFQFSNRFKLFWSPCWRIMLSAIMCLILNPHWIFSLSLQMSLTGALAFSYSRCSKLLGCLACYLAILPFISQWTALHPISILLNWILFPLISTALFPLCVLSFALPVFYPLPDWIWTLLIQFLSLLKPVLQFAPFYIPPLPSSLRWVYIAAIFIVSQTLWITARKKRR